MAQNFDTQNFGTALIAGSQRSQSVLKQISVLGHALSQFKNPPNLTFGETKEVDRGEPQKSCEDAAKLYKLDLSVDAPLCQLLQVLPKDAQNEPEFKEGPIPKDRQIRQVPSSELKQSNTNSSIDFINNNFMVKQVQNQVIVLKNTVSEEQLKALTQGVSNQILEAMDQLHDAQNLQLQQQSCLDEQEKQIERDFIDKQSILIQNEKESLEKIRIEKKEMQEKESELIQVEIELRRREERELLLIVTREQSVMRKTENTQAEPEIKTVVLHPKVKSTDTQTDEIKDEQKESEPTYTDSQNITEDYTSQGMVDVIPVNAKRVRHVDKEVTPEIETQSTQEVVQQPSDVITPQQAIDSLCEIISEQLPNPYAGQTQKAERSVANKQRIINVTKEEAISNLKHLSNPLKSKKALLQCPIEGCAGSFDKVHDLVMHFQTNYLSHDISKLKEPDIRAKMEREIQRRSFKYFITCSFCSCPYECLDSLIIHQKKCIFQNIIVREPIEPQPPPPNPQTPPVEGENGGTPPNPAPNPAPNPVNNPVQNVSNNPIPPRRTLVVGNGAKKQYSKTIHEVSRECNLADRDAIKMRVYEIIPMFQARESEAGNLLSKFFGHFTMSRYTGKVRIPQTEYQFKLSTEKNISFFMKNNSVGKAQKAVERFNKGEKKKDISREILENVIEKNFPKNIEQIPPLPILDGTVFHSQASALIEDDLTHAMEQMDQASSPGASGLNLQHLRYACSVDSRFIQFLTKGLNQIHVETKIADKHNLFKSRLQLIDQEKLDTDGFPKYRVIYISEILLNIFNKILKDKLFNHFTLSPNQMAMKSSGMLIGKYNVAEALKRNLVATTFDVKAAFASIGQNQIINAMNKAGLSSVDVNYIMNNIRLRWSEEFNGVYRGLITGDSLSMMLWCACFDDLILDTNNARISGKVYKYGLAYADDFTLLSVPEHSERAIKETLDMFKNKKLEVSQEKCRSTDTRFMDKTGKITFLSQEFGKQAEPQAKQIISNVTEKLAGHHRLKIATKHRLLMFSKSIVASANWGPLTDVAENNAETKRQYKDVDTLLANELEKQSTLVKQQKNQQNTQRNTK
ncbi:Reverse_transcriptase (RNA-dependent DNA polymerase) [Hexamita inflata]|uniref:Reverse transcriptase (RNA-dependent DNA polymerase) n=1 Tax=Hexamita inflata TaxID=28002 RepID=A0AA86TNT5_9EUKA|nr:Reverse transcriptase (RNA-dependent DNA polymerase) [Hexamita inflata]